MSEPWTGAEHEPRSPDEWWVGCVCGNNHTVSWFRSQLNASESPPPEQIVHCVHCHGSDCRRVAGPER